MNRKFVYVIKVLKPCEETVDALKKLEKPAKVDLEIQVYESADKSIPSFLIKLSSVELEILKNFSKRISSAAVSTGAAVKIIERKRITVMKPKIKTEILVSFYKSKEKYEKLAHEIHRLFEIDHDFLEDFVYTIKHRIKSEERLIEKIAEENERQKTTSPIDSKNYQDKVDDILGMRIVCFRHSDTEKVKEYLNSLKKEQKLCFVKKPEEKLPPFLWIQKPKRKSLKIKDIQYSGYSSFHYVVKPSRALKLPKELSSLRFEIQLRNIFEEAWGELDHKYRYRIKRKGVNIPDDIDRGFRSLSAYLQSASIQAEFLCKGVDKFLGELPTLKQPKHIKHPITSTLPPIGVPITEPETIAKVLEQKVGFIPTERTLLYVEHRMLESGFLHELPKIIKKDVLTDEALKTFRQIYLDIMLKEPFKNPSDRDIDLLNLVNYSLFQLVQPLNVVQENLKSILKRRIGY